MRLNNPERIIDLKPYFSSTFPLSFETPSDTRARNLRGFENINELILDLGNVNSNSLETTITHFLKKEKVGITQIVGGKSGDHVFKLKAFNNESFILKVVSESRLFEFITELSSLFYLDSLNLEGFIVAQPLNVIKFRQNNHLMYGIVQSYIPGLTLSNKIKSFLNTTKKDTIRQQKLKKLSGYFNKLGQALSEVHTTNSPKGIICKEQRITKLLFDVFTQSTAVLRKIKNAKVDIKVYERVWKKSLITIEDLNFIKGHMLLDPQLENIIISDDETEFKLGLIDTSTSFHSIEQNIGGVGIPSFDIYLLTKAYPNLRIEKGSRLKNQKISKKELFTIIKSFHLGYNNGIGRIKNAKQAHFLSLLQSSLYCIWFFEKDYFDKTYSEIRSEPNSNRWISVHFYRDKLNESITYLNR